jgi:quinol monooxygenase YgiN
MERLTMAIRLVVTLTTQPGRGADYANAWTTRISETVEEQGCEQYELFRSTTRSDVVVLLERWTTEHDLEAHLTRVRAQSPVAPELRLASSLERYEVD